MGPIEEPERGETRPALLLSKVGHALGKLSSSLHDNPSVVTLRRYRSQLDLARQVP